MLLKPDLLTHSSILYTQSVHEKILSCKEIHNMDLLRFIKLRDELPAKSKRIKLYSRHARYDLEDPLL